MSKPEAFRVFEEAHFNETRSSMPLGGNEEE